MIASESILITGLRRPRQQLLALLDAEGVFGLRANGLELQRALRPSLRRQTEAGDGGGGRLRSYLGRCRRHTAHR